MMRVMDFLPAFPLFVLGAILASFVGVVAERLHTGQSWVGGRSRCNSCATELGAKDLVPVVSWLSSMGRCRSCGSGVPWRYLLSEAVLGALFALSYLALGAGLALALFLPILVLLLFIVLYDLRHTIIPRFASSLLAALALIYAWIVAASLSAFGLALLAAGGIALAFVLLHSLSGGKAMGLGDAPIAFALSLVTAPLAVTGLVFSFWIGAAYGIGVLVARRRGPTMGIEVPFAPFLAIGFLLAFFTGWNLFPLA